MSNRLKKLFSVLCTAVLAGSSVVALNVGTAQLAQATAGTPGTADAKELIFWEGFENRPAPSSQTTNTQQLLSDYVGGAVVAGPAGQVQGLNNTGITYTAQSSWNDFQYCNGMVMDDNDVRQATMCNQTFYNQLTTLLGVAGPFKDSPSALAAYTSQNSTGPKFGSGINESNTPYGAVQLRTTTSIPVPGKTDRFLAYGLDAGVLHCYPDFNTSGHSQPALVFSYIDGEGKERLIADRVDANGNIVDNTVNNGVLDFTSNVVLPSFVNFRPNQTTRGNEWEWRKFFNKTALPNGAVEGVDYVKRTSVPTGLYTVYTPINPLVINPCTDPDSERTTVRVRNADGTYESTVRDVAAGTYVTHSSFLNTGDSVDIILRNLNPTGYGNDGAIDNLKIYDVTPQLDVNYGVWNTTDELTHEGNDPADRDTIQYGKTSTITYTITNTDEFGSKYGWQFDNTLPEDLQFAAGADGNPIAPVMQCDGVTQTSTTNPTDINITNGNTISVREGFMPIGGKVCTITATVAPTVDPFGNQLNDDRANHRTYTTETASFTQVRGLDLPNPTTITWFNDTKVDVAKSVSPAGPHRIGDTVTYTLTVTNNGTGDFTADFPFVVWDDYTQAADDAEFTGVVSTDPADATVDTSVANKLKWTGALPAGQTATLNYTMQIKDGGDGVGTNVVFAPNGLDRDLANPPTPACAVGDGIDAVSGETCATAVITPRYVEINKTANVEEVAAGGVVTYTLTATNTSKGAYTADLPLVLTDDMTSVYPHGEYQNDASGTIAGTFAFDSAAKKLTWTGPLAPGETQTITYTVKYVGKGPENLDNALSIDPKEAKPGTSPTVDENVTGPTPVPTAENAQSRGPQGLPQEGTPSFDGGSPSTPITFSAENPALLIDPATGQPTTEKTVPALDVNGNPIGSYTIDPLTGKVTFEPNKDFVGTPQPAKVQGTNTQGNSVIGEYQPIVDPVTPTGTPVTSSGLQGASQTGKPVFEPGDPNVPIVINADQPALFIDPATGQPTTETTLPAMKDGKQIGNYTIDPLTGVVTFKPNPDFVGTPDPITVQVKDANGTPATATYTPTVEGVTPTGKPVTSSGLQGETQTGTPVFEPGDPSVPIVINANQPALLIDPKTGEPTTETTVPALNENGNEIGTYTIDPLTGEVTFKPNSDFVGTPQPAVVQVKDANGTPTTATYTPTVIGVTPTGTPVTSEGMQGQSQSNTPVFTPGDSSVPIVISAEQPALFIDPSTGEPTTETTLPAMKDGKKVGTYTIDSLTGTVTFKPNPDFVGEPDPITVQVKDKNGTPATATYTPKVIPVLPTAENVESTGVQGASQTGTPTFTGGDPSVPVTLSPENPARLIDPFTGEPTDETTVPALKDGKQVGTYTIDQLTGTVTFKPNPEFVGTPDPAIVEAKDANGTTVRGVYQPTVTPLDEPEPTDPTDPVKPTDPVTPTDPVVPTNPVTPQTPNPPAPQLNPSKDTLAKTGSQLAGLLVSGMLVTVAGVALVTRRKQRG